MEITNYIDLLKAASMQHEAQRLLFVFCSAELPQDSSAEQRDQFLVGKGGALVPVMCVDKLPGELDQFCDLADEARETGMKWDVVFVAAMSGNAGIAPSNDEAEQPLMLMVEAIKNGNVSNFLPFNTDGELMKLF